MADYYKLAGSKNATTDWTSKVVLEKDDDGKVTKEIGADFPAQLNADDVSKLEAIGYEVEKVPAAEAKKTIEAQAASPAALGSAPLIGSGANPGENPGDNDDDK